MIICKVIGSVVATRKNEKLIGSKFMIVEPAMNMEHSKGYFVAVDSVGAGIGEIVLVVRGSAARIGYNMDESPVDATIVGIVDDGTGVDLVYGH